MKFIYQSQVSRDFLEVIDTCAHVSKSSEENGIWE